MNDRITGYAGAILEVARAEGVLERVENELAAVGQALERSAELRSTLTDPQLPLDRKEAVIDQLVGGRASSVTAGLVRFIVGQGRAADLPSIAKALGERAAATRARAVAEVRSVGPLDQETIDRLASALGKATGKTVEVNVIIDESVMGGIVARVGDTVIDGSIAHRFDELRQAVKGR